MAKKSFRLKISSFFFEKGIVVLLLIIFGFFVTRGIHLPYVGYNAWNFNTYSHIAKNYNTFGYVATKFAPVTSVSERLPEKPEYYLNHPQLLSIVISLLFKVFGEDFWVGRLTVILFSFGSLVLIYLLGKELWGQRLGILALFVAVLLPATAVFGRMIDMEPLVLFFTLATVFFLLQYLKSNKALHLFILFVSIILGTLSDWPMTYFTVALFPLLYYKKRVRLGFAIIATAFVTEVLFLSYVFVLMSGLQGMLSAIANRSTGELLRMQNWPVIWAATIAVRLLLYYNPLFLALATWYLWGMFLRLRERQFTTESLVLLSFFCLGIFYILLFPEGSFGHAYWVYYFIPFVALSSAKMISEHILQRKAFLIIAAAVSILFLWKINEWKVNEVKANIFRYTLAEKASTYLMPFEPVYFHKDVVIDQDLFEYRFIHPVQYASVADAVKNKAKRYYFYACITRCTAGDSEFRILSTGYFSYRIQEPEAELYLFDLSRKAEKQKGLQINPETANGQKITHKTQQGSYTIRSIYQTLKSMLKAPQL